MRYTGCMIIRPTLILMLAMAGSADAAIRVVTWNIAKLQGDHDAVKLVLQEASRDDAQGSAIPVTVFVFQEVLPRNIDTLHDMLGEQYTQATFTDDGDSRFGGAQAMFYRASQAIEHVESHADIATGAGRHADRWRLDLLGMEEPVSLWIYSAHLKASRGKDNREVRRSGAAAICDDMATLPDNAEVIVAGDMNFYTNKEPAYGLLTSSEGCGLHDPLGSDEWAGEDDAIKHTQSPRTQRSGGLVHGGLDDRFDFQLVSPSILEEPGLVLIEGSYRAFGNDGTHFDLAINAGTNSYSDTAGLAEALHEASDHLPVIVDYLDSVHQKPASDPLPSAEN